MREKKAKAATGRAAVGFRGMYDCSTAGPASPASVTDKCDYR